MLLLSDIQQKRIVLYKLGKFQKDIELFFEDLDIAFYLEDDVDYSIDTVRNKKVYKTSEFTKDILLENLIIICSFEVESAAERLENLGLDYNLDFIFGIDLISSICQKIPYESIVVFGTGKTANEQLWLHKTLDVKYYIDNDCTKWDTVFNGKPVMNPKELFNEEKDCICVIIASICFDEIKSQLLDMGVIEAKKIYNLAQWEEDFPSYTIARLLIQTLKAPVLFEHICENTFKYVHIIQDGRVSLCTPPSRKFFSGNLLHNNFHEIINSQLSRLIRLSIINGTYCFCTDFCSNNRHARIVVDENYRKNDYKYTSLKVDWCNVVVLNYDNTCNLWCRSCRNAPIIPDASQISIRETIHNRVINEVLPKTNDLYVSGNGDAFYSKYYREVIFEKYKGDILRLQTNGMLFNEQNWRKLKGKFKTLTLDVSIDAATKETYGYLRRGGDFDVLLKNLELMKELRSCGEIYNLRISFVVQTSNYMEMGSFIDLGVRLGADKITFSPISNFTGLSEEEFSKLNLLDEKNAHHNEFIKMLKEPIFRHEKVFLDLRLEIYSKD